MLRILRAICEKERGVKPTKLILVSPSVEDKAEAIASSLDIYLYTSLV
ncbi:MAG: hypothetical protein H0M93_02620 [Methanophagales archaeon]|nr:hypothetical protein [Methanophagales archaeon]